MALAIAMLTAQQSPATGIRELSRGQTVLIGTYRWNLETNNQAKEPGLDVWWENINAATNRLSPVNDAKLARIPESAPAFEKLTYNDIVALPFGVEPVPGSALMRGARFAIKTTEGNYAKLLVMGYRDSHDFSFDSAKIVPDTQRERLLARPKVADRHLEVSWVLWGK